MSGEYSEQKLVQKAALDLLEKELGWEYVYAGQNEELGENGPLGRKSYKEVLLTKYFCRALTVLNPWITPLQVKEALEKMKEHLSGASLLQINEEKYGFIRDGIPVTVKKPNGVTEQKKALIVDFNRPYDQKRNCFLAVEEFRVQGQVYNCRADIMGFLNGIPLLFTELKNYTVDLSNAFNDNYLHYLDAVPQLFYYNAYIMLSNGMEAKVGTLGSKYEFFNEWKRLKEEDKGSVALETMLKGMCKKENFLDILENFILYDRSGGKTVKILARNHQYLGVNEAVKAYQDRKLREGKLGVFWHTQGSGKSYSMVFLARKIRRKFPGSPTIIVLTDREELNKQISSTFESCGVLGASKASQFIASNGEDLINKLKGNQSFIFTLIHKFNKNNAEPVHADHDILIISDEAHRTQYGIFAENMCKVLPEASRIGFTGTPLFSNDNITERTFGEYISIYDFQRAVEDGATVPLYYENRGEKLKDIENPEINDRILEAIEEADLDEDQQEKLERNFAKEIHILTAEPRLDAIAKDFARHYSDLWTSGKAMFVCLNKVTCVRMYNLVQKYWAEEITALEKRIEKSSQQEAQELSKKLKWMKETEMAAVFSQEQNELKTFKKWGLDILPHRQKMMSRELDKEFKDRDNPLRIVFVCAMWLTGFDVKCLSCLYLDKPLKAHTLMQAIARANRVDEGKSNGLIIDYVGIVKALRKALADYIAGQKNPRGTDPTVDKEKLIARIIELINTADEFLKEHDFSLRSLVEAKEGVERLELIQEGANALCVSPEVKKEYQTYGSQLTTLVKYTDRDDLDMETLAYKNAVLALYSALLSKRKKADNTDLMVEINKIVSDYVEIEPELSGHTAAKQFDISAIDFSLLVREFVKNKKQNLVLKDLKELVEMRLESLIKINPARTDFLQRYQQIIKEYNGEQNAAAIEKTFMDLMDLVNSMDNEQKRYVREGFKNDEELAIYDLLVSDNLSPKDIQAVKKVSSDLLGEIKAKIAEMDHWADKDGTRSKVSILIRDTLFYGLPEVCLPDLDIYRNKVWDYVYERYAYGWDSAEDRAAAGRLG